MAKVDNDAERVGELHESVDKIYEEDVETEKYCNYCGGESEYGDVCDSCFEAGSNQGRW